MKHKYKYYRLDAILKTNAYYYMIIGERSNGKTFSVMEYAIKKYFDTGDQLGIIRRWREDFLNNMGRDLFKGFIENPERGNIISTMSKGRYNDVFYHSKSWYFQKVDEDGDVEERAPEPFAYGFTLSTGEHGKGAMGYPKITTILFDEFLTRQVYLDDEFILFTNVLSTIIRGRADAKIFMCGNTVNKYCPYFEEMGLRNVKKMLRGTIDVYTYGDSDLKVAVEYCGTSTKKNSKASDVYFAFDNPKLKMITSGEWEIDIYPHAPCRWLPKNEMYNYFIVFDNEILQCTVVYMDDGRDFTYIHRKTTPLKDTDNDTIYEETFDPRPNHHRKINVTTTPLQRKLYSYFVKDKIYYQNNEVGETIRNYLAWCHN